MKQHLLLITGALLWGTAAAAQIRVGSLKNDSWENVPNTMVVGYAYYYQSAEDRDKEQQPVAIMYSRNYNDTGADTLFARVHLNGNDVDFKSNVRGSYRSMNRKYRLKITEQRQGATLLITSGKQKKSVKVFTKAMSG